MTISVGQAPTVMEVRTVLLGIESTVTVPGVVAWKF
jgi:hypothetical protein